MKIGAIILAAGYSSRMGRFKPLQPLGGQSFLARCCRLFQQIAVTPLVVCGHQGEVVAAEARRLACPCVQNPDFDRGMYSSLCCGVTALPEVDGFFLLPVDIPLVRPATVRHLCEAFTGRQALIPAFAGQSGHPPLLPATLIPAILAGDGQGGLRALLAAAGGQQVPVWDQGILCDADTADDVAVLEKQLHRQAIGTIREAKVLASLLMPPRGVAHGRAVAAIAVALGEGLNRRGADLDSELLHNAALLHDVGKPCHCHERAGAELLRNLGLAALAESVAVHKGCSPPEDGVLTAKELVCLADKLVRGTQRMPLAARFQEKLQQYATNREACRAIHYRLAQAKALERLAVQALGEDLENFLRRNLAP